MWILRKRGLDNSEYYKAGKLISEIVWLKEMTERWAHLADVLRRYGLTNELVEAILSEVAMYLGVSKDKLRDEEEFIVEKLSEGNRFKKYMKLIERKMRELRRRLRELEARR